MKEYKLDDKVIVGIDEAGRGSLAGPVVVAAVILPTGYHHPKLRDSKKVTKKTRPKLYDDIIKNAIDYSIVVVKPDEIDYCNILQATLNGMNRALDYLNLPENHHILIDGNVFRSDKYTNVETVIKGDDTYTQIAAASILAKVFRDSIMERYHDYFPEYNWAKNKGYGGKEHRDAIENIGYCPLHRKTFNPVKGLLSKGLISEYTV